MRARVKVVAGGRPCSTRTQHPRHRWWPHLVGVRVRFRARARARARARVKARAKARVGATARARGRVTLLPLS